MNNEHPPHPDSAPCPPGVFVEFSDTQSHLTIDRESLSHVIFETLRAEGVENAMISVAVVDDATIRVINRRHLDHDCPTDVISFGLSEPDEDVLSGELVVSAETAANTARQAGVSAADEMALYVVHGLLHLCGYNDKDPEGCDAMRRRESEILARSGLSNTYPALTGDGLIEVGATVENRGRESARWMV